jgi:hypothetical protein
VKRIRDYFSEETINPTEVRVLFAELRTRMHEELEERYFYYLDPVHAERYLNPLHGWEKVVERFPSTIPDIVSAARCVSLGQPTASVFHAMRITEKGIRAFTRRLGIPMTRTADKSWGIVLREVDKEYKTLAASACTVRQKSDLYFYASVAAQIGYFKDAWRNHVSHDKASYNDEQAAGILRSVHDFMTAISSKLRG